LSAELRPLSAVGERVRIDTVLDSDIPIYRRAVEESRERIRPWNPVNADDLAYHLSRQSDEHRTFLIRALPPVRRRGHDIVGKVNLTGIQRGRAFSGVLGYDAYDPYAGQGLFAEGLALVVDVAFASMPRGLGLNRVEAAVQPGNVRSAGLLRSLGFRRRGFYPRYLWLADGSGREDWRDHLVYGVDRGEWPAIPYAPHRGLRPLVLLTPGAAVTVHGRSVGGERDVGGHGDGVAVLDPELVRRARALAGELAVPVLRVDGTPWGTRVDDALGGAVLLADEAHLDAETRRRIHLVVAPDDVADAAGVTRVALHAWQCAHARPADRSVRLATAD